MIITFREMPDEVKDDGRRIEAVCRIAKSDQFVFCESRIIMLYFGDILYFRIQPFRFGNSGDFMC